MNKYTRREFLGFSLTAAAGVVFLPRAGYGHLLDTRDGVLEIPADGYPLIEVEGSYREIGEQIGAAMRGRITSHLELSEQYASSVDYAGGQGRDKIKKMLNHAGDNFPHLVEELDGMAESLDVPLTSLFAFQCRAEVAVMKEPAGCSTIALCTDKQTILAHNEDGGDLNIGRMFLVKVTPPSGVTFMAFVYPGLLPGNGPSFNSEGLVQTTNYIEPRGVGDGIPRYIIGRAILEAKNLDEAVSLATMEPRAFSYHHNLASLTERRILSVETAAYPEQRHGIMKVDGLYVHTNHFLHPGMAATDETGKRKYDVPYESSTTRMDVLSRFIETRGAPSNAEEILKLLSLHERRPYSPCRHRQGDVRGATLGTAVFEAPDLAMTLFHGNPCLGLKKEHVF